MLDARRPHLVPTLRFVSAWVHNGLGERRGVRHGRRPLAHGGSRVLTIDEADVVARAEEMARRVWHKHVERYSNVPFLITLPPLCT